MPPTSTTARSPRWWWSPAARPRATASPSRGIHEVVLVSDPFHAARIGGIASELGLDAATSPTRTSPIKGLSEFRHMVTETAQVSIARVIGFRRLVRVEQRFAVGQQQAASRGRAIL